MILLLRWILVGVSGLILTLVMIPPAAEMLQEGGASRPNYRGETIPVGMGLIFIFTYLILFICYFHWYNRLPATPFLVGLALFCLLGLIDDLLGSRRSRGLRGHFGALMRGQLTTGAVKALGGGLVAILVSLMADPAGGWWQLLLKAVLIALSANIINLLDLRPGRAVKISLLWLVALLILIRGTPLLLLLAPMAGGLLAYAPFDLKARGMLGDTGSNLLGCGLGMVTSWSAPLPALVSLLLVLVLLHLVCEKLSLTEIIEGNRVLRFFDHLGRGEE